MSNQQQVTTGIILTRVDYGEADRIITLLTPDQGKLRLIAKGVRRVKSKLAGGIELFSVSNISFIRGRSDIGTLVSSRLIIYYGEIVKNLDRTMLGYDLTKQLHRSTEDEPEPDYFHLLQRTYEALNDSTVGLDIIKLWFGSQLLRLSGHTPNLQTEVSGAKLVVGESYEFSFDDSTFMSRPEGSYVSDHIKFLRLMFSADSRPAMLAKVQGGKEITQKLLPLVQYMSQQYHR